MLISYCSFLLLTVALSTDTFVAGLSYSAEKVKVPPLSACILSLISGLIFALSLLAGKKIAVFLPPKVTAIFSFFVLLLLALYKLYDVLPDKFHILADLTTHSFSGRVNKNEPSLLTPKEAVLLSLILSIDSLTAGFTAGAPPFPLPVVFLFSAALHFLFFIFGLFIGKKLLTKKLSGIAFLPAVLFLFLAVSRLF